MFSTPIAHFQLENFHKPASKLYQNQYVFAGSSIIFIGSIIILILVYEVFPIGLVEMKAHFAQRILNVTPDTLRSVVEHAVSRCQLLAENSGHHMEHVLHKSREIKKTT